MRDHKQKAAAERAHLLERGFTRDQLDGGNLLPDSYDRMKDCVISFTTGWEEAQKWEVSQAWRNELASRAMQGFLAGDPMMYQKDRSTLVKEAYKIADMMIRGSKA